jgi:hypothetical protein
MWDMLGVAGRWPDGGRFESRRGSGDSHRPRLLQGGGRNDYDFETKSTAASQIILVSDLRRGLERWAGSSQPAYRRRVALFEFHAKMNAIDQDIIDMAFKALERLDSDFDALVIGNNGDHYCAGANLFAVGVAAASVVQRWIR